MEDSETTNIFDINNIKKATRIDVEIAKYLGKDISITSIDGTLEAYKYNNRVYIANYYPPTTIK